MTTIATDGVTMASDSQQTSYHIHQGLTTQKIFRINGALYGFSGRASCLQKYVRWVMTGSDEDKQPKIHEGFGGICVRDGKAWELDDSFELVRIGLPAAIGSGADYALGAMMAGATPKDAVRISSKLDPRTGGRVVSKTVK